MNVSDPLIKYIQRIIESVPQGISKVLYLDKETQGIISQLFSHTQALENDIFLIQQLGHSPSSSAKNMAHLSAIIFCRPTDDNVSYIEDHLQSPKHNRYFIFFSNQLDEHNLSRMARADNFEVVHQIQEFYADVYPINNDLWTLQQPQQMHYFRDTQLILNDNFQREIQGLIAFLLSVKKRPRIRWQKSSSIALQFAKHTRDIINNERQLFGWSEPNIKPLLLICDRRQDPITPLLTQWTYQSMVHDMLHINNSRINIENNDKFSVKRTGHQKEIIMNVFNDAFFEENRMKTFAAAATAIQVLTKRMSTDKKNRDLNSIKAIQEFMEKFPEKLAESGNVSKHVSILDYLSSEMANRKLLEISQLEQEIVCSVNRNMEKDHFMSVERFIENPNITDFDKLRLSIICVLRYCSNAKNHEFQVSKMRNLLRTNIEDKDVYNMIVLVDIFLREFTVEHRDLNLFAEEEKNDNIFKKIVRVIHNEMTDIQCVFTQHNPVLSTIIDRAVECKLSMNEFNSFSSTHKQQLIM